MKDTLRKLLAYLLSFMMLISGMPVNALADAMIDEDKPAPAEVGSSTNGNVRIQEEQDFSSSFQIDIDKLDLSGISPMSVIDPDIDTYGEYEFEGYDDYTQTVKVGDPVVVPPAPKVEDGEVFMGWYEGDVEFKSPYTSVANKHTITAKIEPIHYVFFHDEYGNVYETVEAMPDAYTVDHLPQYTADKGAFDKWMIGSADSGNEFTTATQVTEATLDVYPHTVEKYWVTYNTLGANEQIASEQVVPGTDVNPNDRASANRDSLTRMGYTFSGWSSQLTADGTNGDSRHQVNNAVTINEDTTFYAIWTAENVNYTVVYWGEAASNVSQPATDVSGTNYDVDKLVSVVRQAPTGTKISSTSDTYAPNLSKRSSRDLYFANLTYFQRDDKRTSEITVAADGTSVLNVYYTRKVYTLKFSWNGNHTLTINGEIVAQHSNKNQPHYAQSWSVTVKLGQNISTLWPTASNFETGNTFYKWSPNLTSKRPIATEEVLGNLEMTASFQNYGQVELHYMLQNVNGSTNTEDYIDSEMYRQSARSGGTWSAKELYGFKKSFDHTKKDEGGKTHHYFWYNRESYILTLNNASHEDNHSVLYEAPLATYLTEPAKPAGYSANAEFVGWYTVPPEQVVYDPANTANNTPKYTGGTMPAADMELFAYWYTPARNVTIDVTIDNNNRHWDVTVPEGESIAQQDEFKQAQAMADETHSFLYWVDDDGNQVNVNEQLYHDVSIHAVFIDYNAYTVTYRSGNGTGDDIVDARDYRNHNGSAAEAKSYPAEFTAPEGLTFAYWTDENGNVYYPGQKVPVSGNVVLTAQYAGVPFLPDVTYHYNAPEGVQDQPDKSWDFLPYTHHTIKSLSDLEWTAPDGYTFEGWLDDRNVIRQAGNPVRLDFRDTHFYAQWTRDTGSLTVTKKVEDAETEEAFNITVKQASSAAGKTDEFTEKTEKVTAGKSVTFNGLPTGTYTVAETELDTTKWAMPEAQTVPVTKGATAEVTITNKPATRDVKVTKTWVNVPNDAPLPNEVKVTLTADGYTDTQPLIKGADGSWTGTFVDVPYAAFQKLSNKSLSEVTIPGYTTNVDYEAGVFTVTNTYTGGDKITVSGTKTWIDGGKEHNNAEELADKLHLTRKVNGSEAAGETVNATPTWVGDTYTFSGLQTYNTEGLEYEYSVTEDSVNDYTTAYDEENPNNIINTIKQVSDVVVTVSKAWVKPADETPATEVTVQLLRDGTEVTDQTLTLSESNGWTGSFTGLDRYDLMTGKAYEYTVNEVSAPTGYEAKVEKGNGAENTWFITNTKNDETARKPEKTISSVSSEIYTEENKMVEVGDTITYTITYYNHKNTAQTVTVTDTLPVGVEYKGATGPEGVEITQNDRTVTWKIPNVEPFTGGSVTVTVSVTDKALGDAAVTNPTLKNTASVTIDNHTEESDSADVTVRKEAWTVEKTVTGMSGADGKTAKVGDTLTYTITVKNTGNVPLNELYVSDNLNTLPEGNPLNGDSLVSDASSDGVSFDGYRIMGLDPGEVAVLQYKYEVKASDTELKNVVTTGDEGEGPGDSTETTVESKPALTATKKLTNEAEGPFKVGQTAKFEIEVTNSGNTVQKNVTVTEQLAGAKIVEGTGYTVNADGKAATITEIPIGESVTVYAEYTITQDDIDSNADLKNIAKVDDGDDTTPDPEPGTEIPKDKQAPALTVEKTASAVSSPAKLGDTITYTVKVTNSGNVTVSGITVTDPLTGLNQSVGTLAPGASAEAITTTYTVQEKDILAGKVVNTATAKGTDPDGKEVTGSDSATVTNEPDPDEPDKPVIDKPAPALTVEKTADKTTGAALDDVITYTITVTNTGNVTVSDITVTDPKTGLNETIESLAPNASEEFTTTYTVTEADILAGEIVNVATATGTDPNGGEVTGSDTETVTDETDPDEPDKPVIDTPNGELTVEKTASAENTPAKLGDTITYTITVTNSGNVTVSGITVTDPKTGLNETIESLAPNASEEFTTEYTVTEADILAGEIVNVATAAGTDPNGNPVEGTGSETVTDETDPDEPDKPVIEEPNGHVTITKTTTSTPANGETYALGETITYEITATNDGNLTVTDITVTDELTGDSWTIESLEPGASETFTAEYVVTEADILAGSVKNVATATGTTPDPDEPEVPVEPGDTEDPTDPKDGHVTITKTTTSTPENGETYVLGETITYEITAENDGNLTVTDITVTDELTGDSWTIESLEPGASETFTASHVVTEADILAGSVVNVATAKGTSPDPDDPDVPVDPGDTEDPTEPKDGHVTITKTTTSTPENGETYALGETITYEITAENDGNLTVTDIAVTDELTGDSWTIESLEPGASETFTAEYVVTEADILAGSVKNVATATGTTPDPDEPEVPVEPGDTEDPTDPKDGHVTITKETTSEPENGETYKVGETITYEITATNDGNVTLTNVVVTDELTGNVGENAWTIESLAPGASETFTAEYVVTEDDVLAGSVKNVATATGTDPTDPDDPDVPVDPGEKEVPIETPRASFTIDKTVANTPENGQYFSEGETVNFNIKVTNDGSVTLNSVILTEHLSGVVIGGGEGYTVDGNMITIPTLAPGATVDVKVSYTVTEYDANYGGGAVTNVVSGTATNSHDSNDRPSARGEATAPTQENSYTVTVHYVYGNGGTAAPDRTQTLTAGQDYSFTSPSITGYGTNTPTVAGKKLPRNEEFTVIYWPTPEPDVPGGGTPAGGGPGGGGGGGFGGGPVGGAGFVIIDEYGVPLNIGNVTMNVGDCFE